jgi:tRNA-2-methylthio-N6-dimethylallyladenosine synthase
MKSLHSFYIRTYGCQMNELDSELLVGLLEKRGMKRVEKEEEADLLLFNTCAVREMAEKKVIGKLEELFFHGKKALIGVVGCLPMAKKEELLKKFPHIDFLLGPKQISQINQILDELLAQKQRIVQADTTSSSDIDYTFAKRESSLKAYVAIMQGCNKYCTYCIVPYTRGKEISRTPKDIIEECKKLVSLGYKEVTLLGQNVNSYGQDHPEWKTLFPDLLYQLDKTGLQRIRFLTSHPLDISLALMEAIRDLPSLCEFVHFPVQSGSSRILAKMHRMYTKEEYLQKVALLKATIPDVALGTDIIVGFPTESEEDFKETYSLFEQVRFSTAFIFAYSPREKTPAARWVDDVPLPVKEERLQQMLSLFHKIDAEEKEKRIGTEVEVLVERLNKDFKMLKGKTRRFEKVIFDGSPGLIGTLQKVRLERFNHQTFIGKIIEEIEHK